MNARYRDAVAASLSAEAIFIAMVMVVSWFRGMDPWMVTRVPASLFLGPKAVRPHGFVPADVLSGLLAHLWLAILVGLIYAALLPRLGLSPVVGGFVAAAILYLLGFWILPILFPTWLSPFWLPPTDKLLQVMAHAVYGWVFGAAYSHLTGDH
jgi:predicted permease